MRSRPQDTRLCRAARTLPRTHAMRIAVLLACSLALLTGCGSSRQQSFEIDEGGAPSGGDDAGYFDTSPAPITDGAPGNLTGDAASCPNKCSTDGTTVIDCRGAPLKTCPAGTTCGGGQCLTPCDAANADKSTIGCDYYTVDPDVIQEGQGACFAAYIANTSPLPVTIGLEFNGQTYDATAVSAIPSGDGKAITYQPLPNGKLPPGQIAIVFLAQAPNPIGQAGVTCPITPAINGTDASSHGTILGNAFHITTSQPVVAYDIFPYGGGDAAMTSATLLIPTSAWDTNYVAVNAFPQSQIAMVAGAMPSLDIIAMEDGTTVTINPAVAIQPGSGVPGGQANTPQTYNLAKGQVLQFTQAEELTGSPIQSNKPIGVWGAA